MADAPRWSVREFARVGQAVEHHEAGNNDCRGRRACNEQIQRVAPKACHHNRNVLRCAPIGNVRQQCGRTFGRLPLCVIAGTYDRDDDFAERMDAAAQHAPLSFVGRATDPSEVGYSGTR